jgi:hypothetical protein
MIATLLDVGVVRKILAVEAVTRVLMQMTAKIMSLKNKKH